MREKVNKGSTDSELFARNQSSEALRMAEDKLAQTLALLDDRDGQINKLKDAVKELTSKVSEHQHGAQEAEEEMDELHHENETLRHRIESQEQLCTELRAKVSDLQSDSEQLSNLKVSLRLRIDSSF